jgi:hypothetical protein
MFTLWRSALLSQSTFRLCGDNQAALPPFKNAGLSHRAKRIDVLHLFAKELLEQLARGEIQLLRQYLYPEQLHVQHAQSLGPA